MTHGAHPRPGTAAGKGGAFAPGVTWCFTPAFIRGRKRVMPQNDPTPTAELPSMPKILKNANTTAGAAAMIAPPMIDIFP